MADQERVPSADELRALASLLGILVRTNPPPPGFEARLARGDPLAESHNFDVYFAVGQAEAILTSPPYRRAGLTTLRGWPLWLGSHLKYAEHVTTELLGEWGLARYVDSPPYPGQPENGAREASPIPGFPLIPSPEQCEDLAYALSGIVEALKTLPCDQPPVVRPEDPDTHGAAVPEELSDCEADCLRTLKECGRRLHQREVIAEMSRRGRIHGHSTIRAALARLVSIARLDGGKGCGSKGYGYPGWGPVVE